MTEGIDLGIPGLDAATRIGDGGNAVVFRARQPELDRTVAVKVLNQSDEATRRRFDRERRAMGRLGEHEGIVSVYSTGFTDTGQPYLLMPLMATALDDELARLGTIPWRDAVEMMRDVCATVQFAHDEGVIHRDLKPGNLMLTKSGRVLVADFGLARITTGSAALKSTAIQLTPLYSPPESFEDTTPAATSDVYSLGATLYALIAGHPPLVDRGETVPFLTLLRRINEQPVDPLGPPVPEEVDHVIARALAKQPSFRFKSAREMSNALDTVVRSDPARVSPTGVRPDGAIATVVTAALPLPPSPYVSDDQRDQHADTAIAGVGAATSRRRRGALGLVLASMFTALVAVGGVVVWSARDTPSDAASDDASSRTDLSTAVPSTVSDAVVTGSTTATESSTSQVDGPTFETASSVGPGEQVTGFRLERMEGPYAIGTADGNGRRDLILLDRATLAEVARTPLAPEATNTTDAALLASGELWIAVRGQRTLAVFEPPCQCVDRRVPIDNPNVSTLVALGDTVWLNQPSASGNRILGLASADGTPTEIEAPTGPDSQLWRALVDDRLVVVGSEGVALLDVDGNVVAGPFDVDVAGPDRNDLDAVRLYWSDPGDGSFHVLDANGEETVVVVADTPLSLSGPAYDMDRELFWMLDQTGPWIIGLDLVSLEETERIALDTAPSEAPPKVGGGLVWVTIDGAILGLDPDGDEIAIRLETGAPGFSGFDVTDEQLWIVDPQDPSAVTRYELAFS